MLQVEATFMPTLHVPTDLFAYQKAPEATRSRVKGIVDSPQTGNFRRWRRAIRGMWYHKETPSSPGRRTGLCLLAHSNALGYGAKVWRTISD